LHLANYLLATCSLHQGRFLLAAGSGRVMVRSFHSIVQVGQEMFEKALGSSNIATGDAGPEMAWSRVELSVMLEHVQAHVAPTDVDPGAGIQWLPKIHRKSSEVKRTGALLERVFMPCQMYFRYTRHKGGTPELKVYFLINDFNLLTPLKNGFILLYSFLRVYFNNSWIYLVYPSTVSFYRLNH
jgi:hypothetical protein